MTLLPYTLIAELTHRCPLACAYCSNPVAQRPPRELAGGAWRRILDQARALGVVQLHLTGGEPLLHPDLEELVAAASELGLSCQLVTSAIGLSRSRLDRLAAAGLTNLQISLHELPGRAWPPVHAVCAGRHARELGLPLTLNLVLHRGNLERVAPAIALAEELGADRLELASVQYLGWAYLNREGLLPASGELERARAVAFEARQRLTGKLDLLFVRADLHAGRARACMHGWGRQFMVVAPDGTALPCHAAGVLGLRFDSAVARPLAEIWHESESFRAFRGDDWMQEPCRSCEFKALDFGGCRCQAKLLTGDARATDPACRLSPEHARVRALLEGPRLVELRPRRFA
jgi:PqqA peptide cyclase